MAEFHLMWNTGQPVCSEMQMLFHVSYPQCEIQLHRMREAVSQYSQMLSDKLWHT